MKATPRTHRKGPRKWRESFTVWIDFIGDRSQIGPLLDFIAGSPSDGGGTYIASKPWISDQSWTFNGIRNRRAIYISTPIIEARAAAEQCYGNLKAACHDRWSPYIRLRLLHDDKPDRCTGPKMEHNKQGQITALYLGTGRGPLVLRKYQRGKCPPMKSFHRPKPKPRRKSA